MVTIDLRKAFAIPKIVQAPSQWVKFVFTTQEILHSKALQKLLWQGKS
jgi:hypothetical protein